MRKFLALLLLVPSLSLAHRGGDAVLSAALMAGTTAGVVVGTQHAVYNALMHQELEGWSDKNTGTTTKLERQCGVVGEFHLVGDHRRNYLLFGITNSAEANLVIAQSEIEFIINGQATRYPGFIGQASDLRVDSGWWMMNYVPFPSKDDFKDYQELEVRIPVSRKGAPDCVLSSQFVKSKKVQKEEISYSVMEFFFEGGPSLGQSGAVQQLGNSSALIGFGMNVFPHPNYGFGFNMLTETFEGSNNSRITDKFTKGEKYEAHTLTFGINYVYRHYLNSNLSLQYEPGFGWQTISDVDADNDKSSGDLSTSFILMHKLMFNWTFFKWYAPTHRYMDFFMAIGPVHVWIPHDKINGQKLDGHRFGALVRFGWGI